jgi:hypothetical protein
VAQRVRKRSHVPRLNNFREAIFYGDNSFARVAKGKLIITRAIDGDCTVFPSVSRHIDFLIAKK